MKMCLTSFVIRKIQIKTAMNTMNTTTEPPEGLICRLDAIIPFKDVQTFSPVVHRGFRGLRRQAGEAAGRPSLPH